MVGESVTQIKRYIRLTNLIPKILEMVDREVLAIRSAVELSFLTEEEQYELHAVMELEQSMYNMSRINANGYFDEGNSEEARYELKTVLNRARTESYKNGEYTRQDGCMPLPVPDDAPFFVKDYSKYYKGRAYHKRSLNSNEGWNNIGTMSFVNQPILQYSNEIRSAVLIIHGEKAPFLLYG